MSRHYRILPSYFPSFAELFLFLFVLTLVSFPNLVLLNKTIREHASKTQAKRKQNASKTQARRKQDASKTQAKHMYLKKTLKLVYTSRQFIGSVLTGLHCIFQVLSFEYIYEHQYNISPFHHFSSFACIVPVKFPSPTSKSF